MIIWLLALGAGGAYYGHTRWGFGGGAGAGGAYYGHTRWGFGGGAGAGLGTILLTLLVASVLGVLH